MNRPVDAESVKLWSDKGFGAEEAEEQMNRYVVRGRVVYETPETRKRVR